MEANTNTTNAYRVPGSMDSPSIISLGTSSLSSLGSFEELWAESLNELTPTHPLDDQPGHQSARPRNQLPEPSITTFQPTNETHSPPTDPEGIRRTHIPSQTILAPTVQRVRPVHPPMVDTTGLEGITLPVERDLCWRCGYPGHHRQGCNKSRLIFCSRCGTIGTMSRDCACDRPMPSSNRTTTSRPIPYERRDPEQSHRPERHSQEQSAAARHHARSPRRPESGRSTSRHATSSRSVGVQASIFPRKETRPVGTQTRITSCYRKSYR